MMFHLATANTAQPEREFHKICSNKNSSRACRKKSFPARNHIHQNEKMIRLLQSAASRQGQIKRYLLWHAVFPADSLAVWQQNRNRKCTNQPSEFMKNSFSKLGCKNRVFFFWNQKSQSVPLPSAACNWSRWYYFIMTEPLCFSYQGYLLSRLRLPQRSRLPFCFHTLLPNCNLDWLPFILFLKA